MKLDLLRYPNDCTLKITPLLGIGSGKRYMLPLVIKKKLAPAGGPTPRAAAAVFNVIESISISPMTVLPVCKKMFLLIYAVIKCTPWVGGDRGLGKVDNVIAPPLAWAAVDHKFPINSHRPCVV
jgi:hypothetical protein